MSIINLRKSLFDLRMSHWTEYFTIGPPSHTITCKHWYLADNSLFSLHWPLGHLNWGLTRWLRISVVLSCVNSVPGQNSCSRGRNYQESTQPRSFW